MSEGRILSEGSYVKIMRAVTGSKLTLGDAIGAAEAQYVTLVQTTSGTASGGWYPGVVVTGTAAGAWTERAVCEIAPANSGDTLATATKYWALRTGDSDTGVPRFYSGSFPVTSTGSCKTVVTGIACNGDGTITVDKEYWWIPSFIQVYSTSSDCTTAHPGG